MPPGYVKAVLEFKVEITRARQRLYEKHSRLRQGRLTGKTRRQIYSRTKEVRADVVEETLIELRYISGLRGTSSGTTIANILETIVYLWRQHPMDPVLYLKRCEDPAECDVVIQPDFKPTEPRPTMSADRVHHMRVSNFIESTMELFGKGYTVDDLGSELDALWAAYRRRNPHTHPMDPTEVRADTAEYHRQWRAKQKAQLEEHVRQLLERSGDESTSAVTAKAEAAASTSEGGEGADLPKE